MVIYQCYRCGYENTNKSNLIRHLNRKNVCKPVKRNINLENCKESILNGVSYEDFIKYKSNTINLPKTSDVDEKEVLLKRISNLEKELQEREVQLDEMEKKVKRRELQIDEMKKKSRVNIENQNIRIITFKEVDLSQLTGITM